ncbi:MAG TPA: hypothetical protein VGP22_17945 [Albitalea sp.]|nr:hypothetical protein [Albitalea sp.]
MSTFHPLKTSLMVACLMVFSSSFAADAVSKDEVKAAKDQIKATYKSEKEACDKLKDNAKDVCDKEAKAKEKVAMAELDFKRTGKDADRLKAAKVKAEQDYEVAKEKCDDKSGADKDACKKEAKAVEAKAKADLKPEKTAVSTSGTTTK